MSCTISLGPQQDAALLTSQPTFNKRGLISIAENQPDERGLSCELKAEYVVGRERLS